MSPQQTIETEPTRPQAFAEWFQVNTRVIAIGGAIIVAFAVGYWFWMRSNQIKQANAERGLNQAKQSLAAGNVALAQTDLQRVSTRYKGTTAGTRAALVLAQVNFEQGKFGDGLRVLDPYTTAAPDFLMSAVWALTGDGQLAEGKAGEAATSYQKAADATRHPAERALYLAKSARSLMVAGKGSEAQAIWERLSTDPNAAMIRSEAEVRLGELSVKPAGG